jgi:chromosome partitioning protein
MGNEEYLIGVAALAKYLQVHYNTAHKLITNGTIPATKVGAQWRVRLEDATAYLHNTVNQTNDDVDLPEIIAIVNQKGGVGKSTIAINLSEALGQLGKKVLLLDMDPQSNSSTGIGLNAEAMAMATMTDVLIEGFPVHEAIVESKFGFDVIPTTIALSEAEMELIMRMSRESVLFNALAASQEYLAKYDYVFIDCPPSLGLLTINALVAADSCLIPIAVSKFSLEGVKLLLKTIGSVRQINKRLTINRFVITMADFRTNTTKEFINTMPKVIQYPFAKTVIRKLNAVSEAQFADKPIGAYSPNSEAAKQFMNLAKELIGMPIEADTEMAVGPEAEAI